MFNDNNPFFPASAKNENKIKDQTELIKKVFDGDFTVDRITLDISAMMPKVHFVPYKTVIIFDEIQECPDALNSLKSAFKSSGSIFKVG